MARPTKCSPEIRERILKLIRVGNYRETACRSCGIDPKTLRNWLARGAEGEEPFASLSHDMDAAEADAEARHVLTITSASQADWRAAAWILSRMAPSRWAEKSDAQQGARAPEDVTIRIVPMKDRSGGNGTADGGNAA